MIDPTSTVLSAGGLILSATQVVGYAAASPVTTALLATAGAVTAVCIELFSINFSSDAEIISPMYTAFFGYLIPSEICFTYLDRMNTVISNWTGGFLGGPTVSFFGYKTTYVAAAPYLAGFSFGYMAGSFATRTICHIAA